MFGAETSEPYSLTASCNGWHAAALPDGLAKRSLDLAESLNLPFMELSLLLGKRQTFILAISELPELARCEAGLRDRITDALAETLLGHEADIPLKSSARKGRR